VGTGAVGTEPAQQGGAVAVSADGNTAVVSGEWDNEGLGAVWVFKHSAGVWSQHGDKLTGTGGSGMSTQGSSVAISEDGTTVVVGGEHDDNNKGATWVFFDASPVGVPPGSVNDGSPGASLTLTAYPNPAPGVIRFSLNVAEDQAEAARIRFFDVNGRLVRSMEIGRVTQGVMSLTWDGADDAGRAVAAGTYLIRLELPGRKTQAVKATILR
jgi:hypothetical protein